jgi:hypothetical protein
LRWLQRKGGVVPNEGDVANEMVGEEVRLVSIQVLALDKKGDVFRHN